jgi:hypothetical protein
MINFEKKDKYLLVVGEGDRKDLLTLANGTKQIYSVIEETNSHLVLVDYRKVNFLIQNVDAFNSVRFYETKLPELKTIVLAAVVNHDNVHIGDVWGKFAISRGFNFKVFTDYDQAEQWLLKQETISTD